MTVARVCYCTREQIMRAADIRFTARMIDAVDQAIEAAAENIDGEMNRLFYPQDGTRYFDWPNYQYAYPWRIWLDENELAAPATSVITGTNQTSPTTIPIADINFEPINTGPPYTYIELRRDLSVSFGSNTTPQRDTSITGTFGYWKKTNPAGALAAAMSDTTSTTCQVTSSATPGVGDMLIVDSERMLVTDRQTISTSQTQQGSGCTTASAADNILGVTTGSAYFVDEILTLDAERMLVVDIIGNNLTVKRAFDGTVLATHSGATIMAGRQLVITRGDFGTTAATHLNSAPCVVNRVPALIRSLSIAESLVQVEQEIGAYAEGGGSGSPSFPADLGASLADKWDEAMTRYARQVRSRVI